jgi:tetratricopeptide (TPR) repeat protein
MLLSSFPSLPSGSNAAQGSQKTTPQRYKTLKYGIWALSSTLLVAMIAATSTQRTSIQQIGRDSADSVLNAEHLKDAVAGMDAFTANELLALTPKQKQEAMAGYEDRYEQYVNRLMVLTENITYGEAERMPIRQIQLDLGQYVRLLQQARDHDAAGKDVEKIQAYRTAIGILDSKILPKISDLSRVNDDQMQNQIKTNPTLQKQALVSVFSLLLLGALVRLQILITQRTRRQFNLPLLAASIIAGIFSLYTLLAIGRSSILLEDMKSQAFDSLYKLRQARALSYQANSDESRYLLDKQNALTHEAMFQKRSREIMTVPQGVSLSEITRNINHSDPDQIRLANLGKGNTPVSGLLAGAVKNITFTNEGPALAKALQAWQDYVDLDGQIRQLERSGKHNEAVALCLGESDQAYDIFKKALAEVQKINQIAMDDYLKRSDGAIAGLEYQAAVVLALVALLTHLGVHPRIKEFQ